MAIRIDGKALAAKVKEQVREEAGKLGRRPALAVILVGENPASKVYVAGKEKDCAECGITSFGYKLPEETTQEELLELISRLNSDDGVDGILCQLPLPNGINEEAVLMAIDPDKDVDGFHPMNAGALFVGKDGFLPCTPYGVMEILDEYGIDPKGKQCVVIGRSNIVGKPMSIMLLQRHGTVTICHSRTQNLAEICRGADILVAAVGKNHTVTKDMVKPGAVVIDVAMNRNDQGKLCGDVDFDDVKDIASAITPVPGSVGPMTRAMLMKNTLLAAKKHQA